MAPNKHTSWTPEAMTNSVSRCHLTSAGSAGMEFLDECDSNRELSVLPVNVAITAMSRPSQLPPSVSIEPLRIHIHHSVVT